MAKLISKTYGEALFELALEEQKQDELFDEAKAVREILKEHADFEKLMTHPRISKEEKAQVAEAVFKGRVSREMVGFLMLIIEKGRFAELDETLTYFIDRVKEEKHIGVAFVTTAIDLDEATRTKIEKRLLDTTKYETMEMHYSVDASLIGGMVIRVNDRVVDSSIRTKLDGLTKQLLAVQLG